MSSAVVIGLDLSLAHGACVAVALDTRVGLVVGVRAYATQAKDCRAPNVERVPPAIVKAHPLQRGASRLDWINCWLNSTLAHVDHVPEAGPALIGLEDYAYDAGQGAHQIGEVGGIARLHLVRRYGARLRLRLHDPTTLKMAATGKGNAKKPDMLAAVPDDAVDGLDLKRLGDVAAEDAVDAWHLARLVLVEAKVRAGLIRLDELTEGQRRAFLRVTESNPVNLLDRPYVTDLEW